MILQNLVYILFILEFSLYPKENSSSYEDSDKNTERKIQYRKISFNFLKSKAFQQFFNIIFANMSKEN